MAHRVLRICENPIGRVAEAAHKQKNESQGRADMWLLIEVGLDGRLPDGDFQGDVGHDYLP